MKLRFLAIAVMVVSLIPAVVSDGATAHREVRGASVATAASAADDAIQAAAVFVPTLTFTPALGATVEIGAVVTANYTCSDDGVDPVVASCIGTVANGSAINTATLGAKTFTVIATDNAGNDSPPVTRNYTVVDTGDPAVQLAFTPALGATVEIGAVVTANYTCSDPGGSGIASCIGTVANGSAINTATLGAKTFTVIATDNAGNDSPPVTRNYTVVDTGDPAVQLTFTPALGATVEIGAVVTANYTCSDPGGSGIDSCIGTVANGSAINTATLGAKSFSVTATDNAGNTRTVTRNYTVVDETPPTVTITTPVNGTTYLLGETVPAIYTCSDPGGSGIASCVGDVPLGAAIVTSTRGQKSFSVTATDVAGNNTTVTHNYTVIDVGAPTVTITTPSASTYVLGATVLAAYTCSDPGGSGISSCVGDVPVGSAIDTATLGPKTFSVTATDNDANTTTVAVGYTVVGTPPVRSPLSRIYVSNQIVSGPAEYSFVFGAADAPVVSGDWTGDGHTGFASRFRNLFILVDERGNLQGGAAYGKPGDDIYIGDWNGNRQDTFAVRRGNVFYVRNAPTTGVADIVLGYGKVGDEVFVGDWDGDRKDTFAVRRGNTFFVRNSTTSGPADVVFGFGRAGDEVLVGDWNRDGIDTFGVRRGNLIFIRNDFQPGPAQTVIGYGKPTDELLVGDWNNDGVETFAVRRIESN